MCVYVYIILKVSKAKIKIQSSNGLKLNDYIHMLIL